MKFLGIYLLISASENRLGYYPMVIQPNSFSGILKITNNMIIKSSLLLLLIFFLGTLTITAQDCQSIETIDVSNEIANISGETMGQKLESLLFWSQEEKERRFPIMQDIFPSILISTGSQSVPYEETKSITPNWEDETTLSSYMNE